jgi:hypothetical protein
MRSIGTPDSLMMLTNVCLSSRRLHASPIPAALQIRRNDRRTLAASSSPPS